MAYVLYLGGMAIMNGFKSKVENRPEKKKLKVKKMKLKFLHQVII